MDLNQGDHGSESARVRENWSMCQISQEPIELYEDSGHRIVNVLQTMAYEDEPNNPHEADVISHDLHLRSTQAISSEVRQGIVTTEILAQRWFTGLESARRTLEASTQEGMRFVEGPLETHEVPFPHCNTVLRYSVLTSMLHSGIHLRTSVH
jgi:hypothetical protein